MKLIFKTLFGSHLYGTNTENSDKDYKGIYVESLDNIILKKDIEVVHETTKEGGGRIHGLRNETGDSETELKDLRRFIYDCKEGQTYALDMLFAPEFYRDYSKTRPTTYIWEWTSEIWHEILDNRDKLLSKNVKPYISYCRHQAGKYGLKGSRLGELLRVKEWLVKYSDKCLLQTVLDRFEFSEYVFLQEIAYPNKVKGIEQKETYLNVLGKKFQLNRQLKEVLLALNKMDEEYGTRARLAMENKGVDFKAISHAFRCCFQLIELANTQRITFPLKEAPFLVKIKKGEIPYVDLQDDLCRLMETAIKAVGNSSLPEQPDSEFWDKFILKVYKNV